MQALRLFTVALCAIPFASANDDPADLATQIASVRLDAQECYRVASLDVNRGPLRVHLGEGWIILSKPLNGARLGAVYAGSGQDRLDLKAKNDRLSVL